MGNCLFGGDINDDDDVVIKVVTSNGGIMEFYAPITVEFITDEFPGHAIFKSHDLFWNPLPHHEFLQSGEYYYLLPLHHHYHNNTNSRAAVGVGGGGTIVQIGHVRSNTFPTTTTTASPPSSSAAAPAPAPYRMSFDRRGILSNKRTILKHPAAAAAMVMSSSSYGYDGIISSKKNGFWKVKLVISPKELVNILSEEGRTEELIESVRTVAKCGNGISSKLGFFPDQWSLTNSTTTSTATTTTTGIASSN